MSMDWLLANHAKLQVYVFFGSFAVVAACELFSPKLVPRHDVRRRWFNNITMMLIGSIFVQACIPVAAFTLASIAAEHGWGLLNFFDVPLVLSTLIAIVVMDACDYATHRVFHAVPFLWRFHKVHHCDLDFDCGTALLQHPVARLIEQTVAFAVIVLVGAPPVAIVLSLAIGVLVTMFAHGNVRIAPSLEGLIRRVLVTSDMHRIHHSLNIEEGNRNFGILLSWWDRLFLTYRAQPAQGHADMEVGIAEAPELADLTFWKLLVLPFRRLRGMIAS